MVASRLTARGACESSAAPVVAGDVVSLRFDPTQRYHEKKKRWDDRTFKIAFEDDDLIVVDKSVGTLTVPTDHNEIKRWSNGSQST